MNQYDKYRENNQQSEFAPDREAGAGTAITFLLAGIGIGIATAILLTPKSGRDVRRSIARGYRNTIEGNSQKSRNLRERGSNLLGFRRESGT
jgi:hypothetical protein